MKDWTWTPVREALEIRASRMRQEDGSFYPRAFREIAMEIAQQGKPDSAPALYKEK